MTVTAVGMSTAKVFLCTGGAQHTSCTSLWDRTQTMPVFGTGWKPHRHGRGGGNGSQGWAAGALPCANTSLWLHTCSKAILPWDINGHNSASWGGEGATVDANMSCTHHSCILLLHLLLLLTSTRQCLGGTGPAVGGEAQDIPLCPVSPMGTMGCRHCGAVPGAPWLPAVVPAPSPATARV